jgi:peroxiredoxin
MGHRIFCLLAVLALCAAVAAPVQAKPFSAGDRPSEIRGYELWSGKTVSTDDYRGKWLLVDFFATWCGPCMHELPNLVAETADLRGAKFEVLGISLDATDTVDQLRPVLKKHHARYPMIFQGGDWKTPPATEWGVHGIPATYLVNPQGVIVATNLRGEDLRPVLDFFLSQQSDYAPVSVSAHPGERAAGQPLPVHFDLSNPNHQPLKLQVEVAQYLPVYAADDPQHKGQPVDMQEKQLNPDGPDFNLDVDCSNFGMGSEDISVPIEASARFIEVDYKVQLPGSVDAQHPDGVWTSGYWQSSLKQAEAAEK